MTTAPSTHVLPARLAAALVLAAGAVCWPAPALAAGPPALPGEDVEVSTDVGAPSDLTAGTWRFDVGAPDEPRWFRLRRTVPGSTVHVTLLAPASEGEAVALEVGTPDEDSCGSEIASPPYSWGALMGAEVVVGPDLATGSGSAAEDPCLRAKTLLVQVGRSSLAEGTDDLPVMLRVVEEAPVSSLEGLPVTEEETVFRAPDVSGEASEAEAASGFVDVPEIETGIHRGSVATGRAAVRRISLDWGQHALVRLVSPRLPETVGDRFADGLPDLRLVVRDPLLGEVDSADAVLSTSGVTTTEMVVGPVRYLRRGDSDEGPHLPGDHYLVVEAEGGGGDLEVDYTLQVEVVGEPERAPAYSVDEPFVLGEDETARLVEYDGGDGLLRTLSAGALAVLGAGVLGAGVVLLRRR